MAPLALRLLCGTAQNVIELQHVLEAAPRYSQLASGAPVGAAQAQDVFDALPEGRSRDDKFVLGICVAGAMVGCIDVIRHFPDESTAHVGLLLIAQQHEGKGLGRRAYACLEQFIGGWPSVTRVRIGVLQSNARALSFWSRLGFSPTGESKPYRSGSVASRVLVCTKVLPRATRGE